MSTRKSTFQVSSDVVQGEGSYVLFHQLSFGTVMEAVQKQGATANPASDKEFTQKLLRDAIIEWNWVDDSGAPLPTPAKGLAIENLLTSEIMWLVEQITGKAQAKNSS